MELAYVCKVNKAPYDQYIYDSFSNLLSTEILENSNNRILYELIDYFKSSVKTEYGEVSASTLYAMLIEDKDAERQKEIEYEMIYRALLTLRKNGLTECTIDNVDNTATVTFGCCQFFVIDCRDDEAYEDYEEDEDTNYQNLLV